MASNEGRLEELVPIRFGRMAVSPFTFLRGSAAVMAADLGAVPTTGLQVQACGDCHLMNFGLFATPERNVVFGLNDFDETLPGPWEWDVKRLAASFVVAGRDVRLDDAQAVDIAAAAVRAVPRPALAVRRDEPVGDLVRPPRSRPPDRRGPGRDGAQEPRTVPAPGPQACRREPLPEARHERGRPPRIADQPPLIYHPPEVTDAVARDFFDTYRASLPKDRLVLFDRYRFEDAAIKVVGVGSVGTRCLVALFSADGVIP